MEELWKIYLPGAKKIGQVIKDVNAVYLPDSGVKHNPGILKGTCKTHTYLPLPQVFLLQIMDSTDDNNKKINFSSH